MLITLSLTAEEVELLATLASDQLFRREFIDPKMPGYKSDPSQISTGKALVARLRGLINPACAKRTPPGIVAKVSINPPAGANQGRNVRRERTALLSKTASSGTGTGPGADGR